MKIDIVSDVAGKVWQIPAPAGTTVGEGDPVVILESMKMEIPVEAPAAGIVVEILVAEGEPVEDGDKIGVLERR
ncbi:MAG: acetyl-CoA carboxylase biotin carboxyl carrier protein subunit [Alphaproteobacteria bacterium]